MILSLIYQNGLKNLKRNKMSKFFKRIWSDNKGWHDIKIYTEEEVLDILIKREKNLNCYKGVKYVNINKWFEENK